MTEVVDASVASRRFSTQLLTLFAVLALVLAAIGIYGVIAYSVSQRSFEIALRMALGAQRGQVLGLVVREGMWLAITGLVAGLAGSIALLRLARSLLVDVSLADPLTWLVVSITLALVAAVASFVPARRALTLEPTVALRNG
jgi:putative ABC transport system permease protein